jgi:hypothetical protein
MRSTRASPLSLFEPVSEIVSNLLVTLTPRRASLPPRILAVLEMTYNI